LKLLLRRLHWPREDRFGALADEIAQNELNILASCCTKMRLEGNRASAMLLVGLSGFRAWIAAMTPSNAEALIAFLLYCLAVHVTQQERRKRPAS
jgi:hypothetical protein